MQQTLFVLLRDKPGALHRTISLFRRRGCNIAALHVERSEAAGVSRMTVTIDAPPTGSPRVTKELERLVDVLAVRDLTRYPESAAPLYESSRTQADGICDEDESEEEGEAA